MDRAEEKRLRKLRRQMRTRAWPEQPTVFLVDSRTGTGAQVAHKLMTADGLRVIADGPIEGLPSVAAASRAIGFEAADIVVFCGLGWTESDRQGVEDAIRAEAHVVLGPGGYPVANFGAPLQARARAKRVQVVYGCSASGGLLGWLAWAMAGEAEEVVVGLGPASGLVAPEWRAACAMLAGVPEGASVLRRLRTHLPAGARRGPTRELGGLGMAETMGWAGPALERRIACRWLVGGVSSHHLRRGLRSRLSSLVGDRPPEPGTGQGICWRAQGPAGEVVWSVEDPASLSGTILAESCLALVRERPLSYGFRPPSAVLGAPRALVEGLGLPAPPPPAQT